MKLSEMLIRLRSKIPQEGKLLLAFSGGEDSLFLMYLLSLYFSDRAEALYVNHNLRGEEELNREIERNKYNASLLGIPLAIKTIERGVIERRAKIDKCGIEASARKERYNILYNYARENNFSYILTAHHQDDQAETILMRMLSFSPFWAWGGIRERDGMLVRPLLDIKKEEIKEAIKTLSLEPSLDSTNSDTHYKRNYIRSFILPSLSDSEKDIISKIAKNVSALNDEEVKFITLSSLYASFLRSDYLILSPLQKEETLYSIFSAFGEENRISRGHLKEIDEGIKNGRSKYESKRYVFYFSKDKIKAYKKIDDFSSPFYFADTVLPYSLKIFTKEKSLLDLKIDRAISEKSIIRKARKDDVILLKDGERKISSLLKEKKLPYAIVMEKEGKILAFFSSFLGERDRLSSSLIGKDGECVRIELGR